jgi:hypothetical protein
MIRHVMILQIIIMKLTTIHIAIKIELILVHQLIVWVIKIIVSLLKVFYI